MGVSQSGIWIYGDAQEEDESEGESEEDAELERETSDDDSEELEPHENDESDEDRKDSAAIVGGRFSALALEESKDESLSEDEASQSSQGSEDDGTSYR